MIFDPEREVTISSADPQTHHMNIDYSAYEGFRVRGYTETVLSRGRVVDRQGRVRGPARERTVHQARALRRRVRAPGHLQSPPAYL